MTHDAKSCMERPRKNGAIHTNMYIAPDEKIDTFELDYDGNRDRWNGYDTSTYALNEMNGKIIGHKPLYVAVAQRKDDRKARLQDDAAKPGQGARTGTVGAAGATPGEASSSYCCPYLRIKYWVLMSSTLTWPFISMYFEIDNSIFIAMLER
ncbi:hypothetical protein MKX03_006413 [Papaver bracteatum]|nr:hypothetical protein MKX03_006413 [Papaver bracteatum]